MGLCGWSTPSALVIVVPVRYGSSANGTGPPLRNHGESRPIYPITTAPILHEATKAQPAVHPILWGDWQRRFHRRELVKLLRSQQVEIRQAETFPLAQYPPPRPLSPHTAGTLAIVVVPTFGSQCRFGGSAFRLDHPVWDPGRLCRCSGLADLLTPHKNVVAFLLSSIGISVGASRHAAFPSLTCSFSLLCSTLPSLIFNSAASPCGKLRRF